MLKRRIAAQVLIAVVGSAAGAVAGQSYPNKPIRLVCSEAGGGPDITARIIAQELKGSLGQVIVDNRPTVLVGELVAKAMPDGYTLGLHGSVIWIEPLLRNDVAWDPVNDFSPITLAYGSPLLLIVNPAVPVKSVKELVALAKAKPGALNYAGGGIGGATYLASELFKAMAGVDVTLVNYKSSGQGLTSLIGGETNIMFVTTSTVAPFIKSGRLRALAVTSARPSALAPDLPTIAASGVPGYEASQIAGIFAPAKTPATIISRLNQEIVRALNQSEVKEKILAGGAETITSSPAQFSSLIKTEMAKWGKVIKDAGMKASER